MLKMPKMPRSGMKLGAAKVTPPIIAKLKEPQSKSMPMMNFEQFMGPKTTSSSKAEGRLKVAAGKKIKIMKSAIKAFKPKK